MTYAVSAAPRRIILTDQRRVRALRASVTR
jgi:hypothetical protein